MIKTLGALAICCLITTTTYGQINTDFAGMTVGATNFTLNDPNNSSFTVQFDSPGEIALFDNPSLFNGSSDRAFALDGQAFSDIFFSAPATVSLTALNTNAQVTGGNSITEPAGTFLGQAFGTAEAFDIANNSLGVFSFSDTAFTTFQFSGPVNRVRLENTGENGSYALVGNLSAQAVSSVPEPGSSLLFCGLAGLTMLRRRRR